MGNFTSEYRRLAALVETRLLTDTDRKSTMYRASNYSLRSGGKRFRSVLTLAVAQFVSKLTPQMLPEAEAEAEAKLLSFACALELLHTASLIHDDLPALDNDNFRRGRPSCHRVYGEGTALLSGDFLISLAINEVARDQVITADQRVILIQQLTEAFADLCEGQVLDLEAESGTGDDECTEADLPKDIHEFEWLFSEPAYGALQIDWTEPQLSQLVFRHRQKTGALLRAAVLAPLAVAGWEQVKVEQFQILERFSLALGLLFQLTDDLLDVEGEAAALGKPVGSDERRQLPTFVSLLGLSRAHRCSELIHGEALRLLARLGPASSFLAELATSVLRRSN